MGSLVFEKCYPSQDAAADAFFSAKEPSFSPDKISYQSWFEKSGTIWLIKRQSIDENGVVTNLTSSIASVPAFPSCDESAHFSDGVAVGWLVAGVMLITWGLQYLRRVIQ